MRLGVLLVLSTIFLSVYALAIENCGDAVDGTPAVTQTMGLIIAGLRSAKDTLPVKFTLTDGTEVTGKPSEFQWDDEVLTFKVVDDKGNRSNDICSQNIQVGSFSIAQKAETVATNHDLQLLVKDLVSTGDIAVISLEDEGGSPLVKLTSIVRDISGDISRVQLVPSGREIALATITLLRRATKLEINEARPHLPPDWFP